LGVDAASGTEVNLVPHDILFGIFVPAQGDAINLCVGATGDNENSGDGEEFRQRRAHYGESSDYRNYSKACAPDA